MNKKLLRSLGLLLLSCLYAESTFAVTQQAQAPMPPKDSPQYCVLRSEAVRELSSFMTKKRSKLRRKYSYFPAYLEQIGKLDDYSSQKIKVPNDPKYRLAILGVLDKLEQKDIQVPEKAMSWNQVIEVAMQFVWSEGYIATDVETGEELQRFKEILQDRERFCRKVRDDVKVIVDECIRAWFYLGTIDRQKAFGAYLVQAEAKRKEDYLKQRAERAAQVKEQMRRDEQAIQARKQRRENERLAQEREQMRQYNQQLRAAQIRERIDKLEEDLRRDSLRYRLGYGY